MDIKLADLTIQPGWTAESQLIKIEEEANEVREALARGDIVNVIRESLDAMQTYKTLIQIYDEYFDGRLDIDKFLREHREKLVRKGYMGVDL